MITLTRPLGTLKTFNTGHFRALVHGVIERGINRLDPIFSGKYPKSFKGMGLALRYKNPPWGVVRGGTPKGLALSMPLTLCPPFFLFFILGLPISTPSIISDTVITVCNLFIGFQWTL
jgi:hypothetical protein